MGEELNFRHSGYHFLVIGKVVGIAVNREMGSSSLHSGWRDLRGYLVWQSAQGVVQGWAVHGLSSDKHQNIVIPIQTFNVPLLFETLLSDVVILLLYIAEFFTFCMAKLRLCP